MNKHELYDIEGAWHVPFWQTQLFYGVVALLVCCVVLLLIMYSIQRYRRRIVNIPIDQKILLELRGFKDRGLIDARRSKEFYGALTATIKNYLAARYAIECHGKTDDELMVFLATFGFESSAFNELQSIFSGMALIKFANMQGAQEQIERDWHSSIAFVQQTAQRKS